MSTLLNARDLVTNVRDRILDKAGRQLDDATILRFADTALQQLYTTERLAGQDYDLDRMTVLADDFVQTTQSLWEYQLPEYVGEVRLLERATDGQPSGGEIRKAPTLAKRALSSGILAIENPVWFYSRQARPGWISIAGRLGRITEVTIWYIRKWAPLHFGTAAGGSTSTILFGSSANTTGKVMLRDDLYIGMDVEMTNNSPAGVEQQLGRISDYVGSTKTATVFETWGTAPDATTEYALVVPLDGEYTELLIESICVRYYERTGNLRHADGKERRLQKATERLISGLARRQSSGPKRITSRRVR